MRTLQQIQRQEGCGLNKALAIQKTERVSDSSLSTGSVANAKFLKNVIKLNNWFIVHQLSAYRKADQKTRDHLDGLYAEFNRRWKLLLQENKLEDLPPQNTRI